MKRGDIVEVEVTDSALGGSGLGEIDGLKVFVNRGIPGQKVKARVSKFKRRYAEAKTIEIVKTSSKEVKAKCPYFASSDRINKKARNCGGCLWQHLSYEDQLVMKEKQVRETLEHVGRLPSTSSGPSGTGYEIRPILGSPEQWHYRNKIELSFGHPSRMTDDGEKVFDGADFGFRMLGMFREVVPITECVIFDPELPPVIDAIRRYVKMQDWEVFDFDNRPNGFWQYLIIRRGVNTGEWMINFITRPGHVIDGHLVTELREILGEKLQSVLHTVNFGKAIGYAGHDNKKVEVLFGRDYILETIGEFQFKISPFSFFQTNTAAAKVLYDVIKQAAALTGKEKVLDMYCGTGTIGQYVARDAREVVGIEILKEAVADAEVNARNNRLANCHYITGDAAKILHFQRGKFLNVDCVIMDPPRAGIAKKGLMSILKLAAPRIVYVSCNPSTLARDLEMICSKRYKIQWVQPVDLFPHTGHVESVVMLERVVV